MIITVMNSLEIKFTGFVCCWCVIELFWVHPKMKIIKFKSLEQNLWCNTVLWKLYGMKYWYVCLTLFFSILSVLFSVVTGILVMSQPYHRFVNRWTIINENYCLVFNSELAWDGCLMKCYSQSLRLLDLEE